MTNVYSQVYAYILDRTLNDISEILHAHKEPARALRNVGIKRPGWLRIPFSLISATRHPCKTSLCAINPRQGGYAYHGFVEAHTQQLGIPPRSSARTRSSPRCRMQLSTRRRRILSSFQGLFPTYVRTRNRAETRARRLHTGALVHSRRHHTRGFKPGVLCADRVRTSSASD